MAVEQRGVSLGAEAAACSRALCWDILTPYSSALLSDLLGWRTQCIIYPGLMHARCPISAVFGHYSHTWPPSCRPLWPDPRDPSDDLRSKSLFFLTWDSWIRIYLCCGHRCWCPSYIKHVKYYMLLTHTSYCIMGADICGFFVVSMVCSFCAFTLERCTYRICKYVTSSLSFYTARFLYFFLYYN